jgi:hypothetical protein
VLKEKTTSESECLDADLHLHYVHERTTVHMHRGLELAWALRHGHENLNNGQSIDYRRNMG